MKIGILGTSDIAFRRFLPALEKCSLFEFAGIASRDPAKTQKFTDLYGGRGFEEYEALIEDEEICCVYIPLPPSLHFEWALKALERGKHVMIEKPFTTSFTDTSVLIELAQEKNLALHENYMFQYHSQIDWIRSKLPELGDLRLIRLDFGFPFRSGSDFRYDKILGGGALLDCGGYTLKLASLLLGETARITTAMSGYTNNFNVDIYGSATLVNNERLTAQVSFGMDNSYRCSLDAWGNIGSLSTDRVFTAPEGFEPKVNIRSADGMAEHKLEPDDSFEKSIDHFAKSINDINTRTGNYVEILQQAVLLEQFKELANKNH